MKTKHDIAYYGPQGLVAVIPSGTGVSRAENLEENGWFWADRWAGMSELEESWARNYGFMVNSEEVDA